MVDIATWVPLLGTAMIVEGVAFIFVALWLAVQARLHGRMDEVEHNANGQTINDKLGAKPDGWDSWRSPFNGSGPVEIGIRQHRRPNGSFASRN